MRQRKRETTYERMAAAKERQDAGEEGEGTIGGKSGRPRKGGRVQSEREETGPYKTEARGEKEICIAGPRDGVNRGQGRTRDGSRNISGKRGFYWRRPKGLSNDTYHTWNHTPADTYVRYRVVFLRRSFSLRFHQLDRAKERLSARVKRTPSLRVKLNKYGRKSYYFRLHISD